MDIYIGRHMSKRDGQSGAGAGGDAKAVRLADALRQNLRKRKAQSRARRKGAAITGTAGAGTDVVSDLQTDCTESPETRHAAGKPGGDSQDPT